MKKVLFAGMLAFAIFSISSYTPVAIAGPTVTLKLTHVAPPDHFWAKDMDQLAAEVLKRTKGEVKIETYHGSQLGSEREFNEAMRIGTVDMALHTAVGLSTYVPSLELMGLPMLFRDWQHLKKFATGPVGERFLKSTESAGYQSIALWGGLFREIMTRNKPVNKPEDLKGLKLRIMQVPYMVDMYRIMGASPTPIAFSEIYTGLQSGIVDGIDQNYDSMIVSRYYEQCKYVTNVQLWTLIPFVSIGKESMKKLNPEQQKILIETVKELSLPKFEEHSKLQDRYLKELKDDGIVVTKPDREAFKKVLAPIVEVTIRKHPAWKDAIDQIQKM